jgi:hypothetical protein
MEAYTPEENAKLIGTLIDEEPENLTDIIVIVARKDTTGAWFHISKNNLNDVCGLLDVHMVIQAAQADILLKVHEAYHNAMGVPFEQPPSPDTDQA